MTDLADRRGVNTTVYQPAEDSGLLAKAAVGRVSGRVLEVGTGSGWVSEQLVRKTDADVVASDLNPHACRQAAKRAAALREEGERGFQVVRGNLVSPFRDDSFDAVAFNPPYLPADPDAERDDWMETALTGGEDGRAVIDPFLDAVGRVLKPEGEALLLVSSLSGYDDVLDRAEANGFSHEVVVQESYPFETLTVLALK
ncbi:methyltransferase [Haloferax elongans ATCC BAA-1513]|uniref:Methyltransferase n=1 Tax=Haloferax elongans ATCC BAA-1513 TaxID=1230453 RepID=M0HJ44_HALEO|nr:HemK2/MTQ2 family protein methyltransferase [Haloferax elongans]ELZ83104.1 methyltransferase [Haloferax elongans ATCC BAA-1513]